MKRFRNTQVQSSNLNHFKKSSFMYLAMAQGQNIPDLI